MFQVVYYDEFLDDEQVMFTGSLTECRAIVEADEIGGLFIIDDEGTTIH